MSNEVKVYTESGKIYYINERGRWFYVSKPSWIPGRDRVGSAESMKKAALLIELDSGEDIASLD